MDRPTRPLPSGIPQTRSLPTQDDLTPPFIPEDGFVYPKKRPSFFRRKYLVYPKFQVTLIVMQSIVMLLLVGFVLFQFAFIPGVAESSEFIPALKYSGLGLLVALVVSGLGNLFISHRLAGPIVRLRKLFYRIAKTSDFPEMLSFRKGDFFTDLPPLVNQAFISLKKRWYR